MSNERPRAVDSRRKRDEALNLADFKIDDILSVPGDRLFAEVAEDFGDPAFLAAEFDSIALSVVSSHQDGAVNPDAAAATSSVRRATLGAAALRAFSWPSPAAPWSFQRAVFATAQRLAVPLRSRTFLGVFATLLMIAVLAPGIYPLMVKPSADRIATAPQDDPSVRSQAPTVPQPSRAMNQEASPVSADQSPAAAAAPPPAPSRLAPSSIDQEQLGTVTANAGRDMVGVRQASSPLASVAPRAQAPQLRAALESAVAPPAGERAAARGSAVAKSRFNESGGFVVRLAVSTSEAGAQSMFRALKSKYTILHGREPLVRRMEEGRRGVFYAVQVPLESQDEAEQLCARLKAAGGTCSVVRN